MISIIGRGANSRLRPVLVFATLLCAACSSVEKVTHYRAQQSEGALGWTYRSTTARDVPPSRFGYPAKVIYRREWRWFRANLYQYAVIRFDTYGSRMYTVGPLFLPVIPNFGLADRERYIDRDANLAFTLAYVSDPALDATAAQVPVPEIVTDRGVSLKPRVDDVDGGARHFTFDVKIRDLPWFTLRKATIRLADGRVLDIPETRFELGKSIAVNLLNPIAP